MEMSNMHGILCRDASLSEFEYSRLASFEAQLISF